MIGGFRVAITGSSLGANPVVSIGDSLCAHPSVNALHSLVECDAPARTGTDTVVVLDAGGQSAVGPAVAYDAPTVAALVPNVIPAVQGGVTELRGSNFGSVAPPAAEERAPGRLEVTLNDVVLKPDWVSDSRILCIVPGGMLAGDVNVSVTVWNTTGRSPQPLVAKCDPGYYGSAHGACERCPVGGNCAGGSALPIALPGYFSLVR